VDNAAGRVIESLIRTHHQRRMDRNGWSSVLELDRASAADAGGAPLRRGNSVEVFVDGDATFGAMLDTIRGARRSVHIAGWHATPDFAMTRGTENVTLGDALREASRRAEVRVLMWGGAQLPVIHPTRSDARRARDGFLEIPGVVAALDDHEYLQHCHHEKLLVVDDRVAYVGGLDLTDLTNDRWDTSRHEPRESLGWHDAAVRLQGPVVADVAAHLNARWHEVTGERLVDPEPPSAAGPYDVRFVRTVPERIYGFLPGGEFTVLAAYRHALAGAKHLIYLENQFLWAPEIVDILEDKLLHPPSADFRLVLLLPRRPATGRDTTLGQLSRLVQADVDNRLLPATLQAMADDSPGTYVHAKVGIVDDQWLTIGSTNLNAHSLFNDTEANVVVTEPELVRDTRLRLWREHLGITDVGGDPARLFDETWVRIADEQLARRRAGKPPTHRLCRLEDVSARRDLVLGGLFGLIVDG
jgi:phosphatidylserine/phosphatidylglycerophosphate/cardiolipin synthase-like enzyme